MILQGKMEEIFGGSNLVSIGVEVKEGDIFNVETLAKIFRINEEVYYLKI